MPLETVSATSEKKSIPSQSFLHRGLSYVWSWVSWGGSLAVNTSYSMSQYAKGFLRHEQIYTQTEDKQVKENLSITEQMIADGLSGAVKGVAAATIIYSGASLPVVGLVSLGLLPKNTISKLGKKVLGNSFETSLDIQTISNHALSIMRWVIPTSWMQIGLKKGSDVAINLVGSESLTRIYLNYHIGERIWLWTGAIGNIRNDLKIIFHHHQEVKITQYQNEKVTGIIRDTYECESKGILGEECKIVARNISECDLLGNTERSGRLETENNGQSWMPVTYKHISDKESYQAEYENGRLVRESKIPHLPEPSYINNKMDITDSTNAPYLSWADKALYPIIYRVSQITALYSINKQLLVSPIRFIMLPTLLKFISYSNAEETNQLHSKEERSVEDNSVSTKIIDDFAAIDKGDDHFISFIQGREIDCKKNEHGEDLLIYAIKKQRGESVKELLRIGTCFTQKLGRHSTYDSGQKHPLCLMIKYLKDSPHFEDVFQSALTKTSEYSKEIRCATPSDSDKFAVAQASTLPISSQESVLETILTYAISEGIERISQKIIDQEKYDLWKIKNSDNLPPIAIAMRYNNLDLFRLLLDKYTSKNMAIPETAYNIGPTKKNLEYLCEMYNGDQENNKITFLKYTAIGGNIGKALDYGCHITTGQINKSQALLIAAENKHWHDVFRIFKLDKQASTDLNVNLQKQEKGQTILYYLLKENKFTHENMNFINELTIRNFNFDPYTCSDMRIYFKEDNNQIKTILEKYHKHNILGHLSKCLYSEDMFLFVNMIDLIMTLVEDKDNKERKQEDSTSFRISYCDIVNANEKNKHILFYVAEQASPKVFNNFLEKCKGRVSAIRMYHNGCCSVLDFSQINNKILFSTLIREVNITETNNKELNYDIQRTCSLDNKSVFKRLMSQNDYDNFKYIVEKFPHLVRGDLFKYKNVFEFIKDSLSNLIEANKDQTAKEDPYQICRGQQQILKLYTDIRCTQIHEQDQETFKEKLETIWNYIREHVDKVVGVALGGSAGYLIINNYLLPFIKKVSKSYMKYDICVMPEDEKKLEQGTVYYKEYKDEKDKDTKKYKYTILGDNEFIEKIISQKDLLSEAFGEEVEFKGQINPIKLEMAILKVAKKRSHIQDTIDMATCVKRSWSRASNVTKGISAVTTIGLFGAAAYALKHYRTQAYISSDTCTEDREIWLNEMEQICNLYKNSA